MECLWSQRGARPLYTEFFVKSLHSLSFSIHLWSERCLCNGRSLQAQIWLQRINDSYFNYYQLQILFMFNRINYIIQLIIVFEYNLISMRTERKYLIFHCKNTLLKIQNPDDLREPAFYSVVVLTHILANVIAWVATRESGVLKLSHIISEPVPLQ